MKGRTARFFLSIFTSFPTMKKILLSLLFALMALVMACGNRAEARVAVSINVGCPRPACVPCPPPCYGPAYYYGAPCPPPYYYCPPCRPVMPPRNCHVHRPHLHYAVPRHGHSGHRPAPHRAQGRRR